MNNFKFPDSGQKIGDIRNPMSFTKLDERGKELDATKSWADGHCMTRDNNTGLIWEVKSLVDGALNHVDDKYSWEDAQRIYITKLNREHYCSFNDWRIPNKDELRSIIDYSRTEPAIDLDFFPNMPSDFFWTNIIYQMQPVFGWVIFTGLGSATANSLGSRRRVIAVRGGYNEKFGVMDESRFTDNGDGTVTDLVTNLMWQQGDNERMNLQEAREACKKMDLGGYADWRLPNIKELNTILNLDRTDGWWYFKTVFPVDKLSPPLLHYYSDSSYETNYAWVTNFNFGYDGYYANPMSKLLFRAVRTVANKIPGEFKLSESGQNTCYAISGEEIAAPAKNNPLWGQDGCFKINPFDFSVDEADSFVFDRNTGLTWERKSLVPDDFNFAAKKYTLEQANEYIAALNRKNHLGHSDWRLPNCQELRTIVDYKDMVPPVDSTIFPDTLPGFYWSCQPYVPNPQMNWGIYFGFGCAICYNITNSYYVRAVCGGFNPDFGLSKPNRLVDHGDGTVSDLVTGLMWKKEESGQLGFEEALKYCDDLELGGYTDWRMPNIRELGTLLDINYRNGNWHHKEIFPDVNISPLGFYWSGTTFSATFGWGVNFQFGYDGYYADKINGKYPFRPVRNFK